MAKSAKQRIAILGGGVGALVTAFELTDRPELRERYDITVYQMGWRLGGKGASGRNREVCDRIEEHGVHVFLGFYENAFRVMRKCYEELGRPTDALLARCFDGPHPAFKRHDHVSLTEHFEGELERWELPFPTKPGLPGDIALRLNGDHNAEDWEETSPWRLFIELNRWLVDFFDKSPATNHLTGMLATPLRELPDVVQQAVRHESQGVELNFLTPLHVALKLAESFGRALSMPDVGQLSAIRGLLHSFIQQLSFAAHPDADFELRKIWITMRLGTAILIGMIDDRVVTRGFDVIDHWDLTEWLRRHGATSRDVWWSPPVRGIYALVFGFEPQDITVPNLAAGAGLRGTLKTFFGYRGSLMWKMQAGMGDTIFAPLYRVLERRGVRFEFFHRVDRLGLSGDGRRVEEIHFSIQAITRGFRAYQPLYPVREQESGKTLECWPSSPNFEQLDITPEQQRLFLEYQRKGVDPFESAWSDWPIRGRKALRHGTDFDLVVLGISVGALPHICRTLIAASPQWQQMVRNVRTVQTQATQLWLKENWNQLGWDAPWDADAAYGVPPAREEPMVSGFDRPYDSWVGMSQLIPRENFPAEAVQHIAYFFAPLQDADVIPLPSPDTAFPEQQHARVRDDALRYLEQSIEALWPEAVDDQTGFRWDLLVGANGAVGPAALDTQFLKANVSPSDRYVLSQRGTIHCRLAADESGYDNLLLAGDWTRTGLNSGCAEAATMSGMQAARAICGYPRVVVGETDFGPNSLASGVSSLLELPLAVTSGLGSALAEALATIKKYLDDPACGGKDFSTSAIGGITDATAGLLERLAKAAQQTDERMYGRQAEGSPRAPADTRDLSPDMQEAVARCVAAELEKRRRGQFPDDLPPGRF